MERDIIDNIVPGRSDCVMDFHLKDYNDNRITPLADRIAELEKIRGMDGREVEFLKGLYPVPVPGEIDTPDTPETRAILWRLVAREGEEEEAWKCLIFLHEIQGDKGDEGDPGPQGVPGADGSGMKISGVMSNEDDLIHNIEGLTINVGDCWLIMARKDVWVCVQNQPTTMDHWKNLGPIHGIKGDKGAQGNQGPQGKKGEKGDGGGISDFLLNWIVSTATNAAITGVMLEVNTAVNDAIELMAGQLANLAEDAAEAALEKVMDDMMDEFKGDKGEKGDKGDKGKDGKSVEMVGSYEYLTQFRAEFPANASNVGKAALIGKDNAPKELWCIVARPAIAGIVSYTYDNLGDITGPPGRDAAWDVSIRDTHFVEKMAIEVASDLPDGVAGMYVQESSSISLTPTSGSEVDPKQVGFKIEMKYPIPQLIKEDGALGSPTVGKVLSNDGEKLQWVDGGTGGNASDEIFLKSMDGSVFEITIGNDGRLKISPSDGTEATDTIPLTSPNGKEFLISIQNDGRLKITENK